MLGSLMKDLQIRLEGSFSLVMLLLIFFSDFLIFLS
jgi:hypothetical protein